MTLRLEKTCSPETFLPWSGIMWSTWCGLPDACVNIAASWYLAMMRCAWRSHAGVRWRIADLRLAWSAALTGLLFLFHSLFVMLCWSILLFRHLSTLSLRFSGLANAQALARSLVSSLLCKYHSLAKSFWFSFVVAIPILYMKKPTLWVGFLQLLLLVKTDYKPAVPKILRASCHPVAYRSVAL